MQLDHFQVIIRAEHLHEFGQQFQKDIDTDAHVRGPKHPSVLGDCIQLRLLLRGEARRPDDDRVAVLDGAPGIGKARFRCRKIDHDGPRNLRVHDFGIRSGEASPMGQRVQPFRTFQYGRKRHALLFRKIGNGRTHAPGSAHHDNRKTHFPHPLSLFKILCRVFGRRRRHLIVRLQQSQKAGFVYDADA